MTLRGRETIILTEGTGWGGYFFAEQVNWPSPTDGGIEPGLHIFAVFSFQTNGKWFRAVLVSTLDPQS